MSEANKKTGHKTPKNLLLKPALNVEINSSLLSALSLAPGIKSNSGFKMIFLRRFKIKIKRFLNQ